MSVRISNFNNQLEGKFQLKNLKNTLIPEEIIDHIDEDLKEFDLRLGRAVPNDIKTDVISHFTSLIKANRQAHEKRHENHQHSLTVDTIDITQSMSDNSHVIFDIEEATTPELVSSRSLASLSDDAITPLTSGFNTQQDIAQNTTATHDSIDQSISTIITISPKKMTLSKSITTAFNSLRNSLKRKTSQLKSTLSTMSLSSKSIKSSERSLKASSSVTESIEFIQQDQPKEIPAQEISDPPKTVNQEQPITQPRHFENSVTITYVKEEQSYNNLHQLGSEDDILTIDPKDTFNLSFQFEDLYDASYDQYDKLCEEIKERSREYQEYFAAEIEQEQAIEREMKEKDYDFNVFEDEAFKTPLQATSEEFGYTSMMPLPTAKKTPAMTFSKTEGLLHHQDSVPYVRIGESNQARHVSEKIEVDDVQMYKRSMTVFSHIKDYDLHWQEHFHEDHKDITKLTMTLRSVAWSIYEIVEKNHKRENFDCDSLFNDRLYTTEPGFDVLTEPQEIFEQIAYVFECGDFTSEHAVLAYIYVKRMIKNSKQRLWDFTWRYVTLTGILTAIKAFDDCAVFNADYAMVFPKEMPLSQLNKIEAKFLELLEWNVTVGCSEFAETYFELRSIQQISDEYFE